MRGTGLTTREKAKESQRIPAVIATKVPSKIICVMGRACSPLLAIIVAMWGAGNAIKSTVKVFLTGRMALSSTVSG